MTFKSTARRTPRLLVMLVVLGVGSSLLIPSPAVAAIPEYCCLDLDVRAEYDSDHETVTVSWNDPGDPELLDPCVRAGSTLSGGIVSRWSFVDCVDTGETSASGSAPFQNIFDDQKAHDFYVQVWFDCRSSDWSSNYHCNTQQYNAECDEYGYCDSYIYVFSEALFVRTVPPPKFTVTVADRYMGRDGNKDGFIDYFPPTDKPAGLEVGKWRVTLRADNCESGVDNRWNIEGTGLESQPLDPVAGAGCKFVTKVSEEGAYDVTLTQERGGSIGEANKTFEIDDLLIVSLGDSFGSGEGNPDKGLKWQSKQCHRSARSGFAKAAARVAADAADEDRTVTFVHLACSGGLVADPNLSDDDAMGGLLDPYKGVVSKGYDVLPSQLDQMEDLLGDRLAHVDAVMISAGGNDIGFATIIKDCILNGEACKEGTRDEIFEAKLEALHDSYGKLGMELDNLGVGDNVLIAQYPDFTRDDDGKTFCQALLGTFSRTEWKWANGKLTQLNDEIAAQASEHGWATVSSHVQRFRKHGYCAKKTWMVSVTKALLQANLAAPFHPNAHGQAAYATALYPVLKKTVGL